MLEPRRWRKTDSNPRSPVRRIYSCTGPNWPGFDMSAEDAMPPAMFGACRWGRGTQSPAAWTHRHPEAKQQATVPSHDHHTLVAIPHHRFCPTPLSHRHWPPSADGNRQRRLRLAKPGASNTRSLCRSHPGRPKPPSRCSLNPRPCLQPTNQIKHRRQIPIDRHHRRRELPRGFLPRGFSDACRRASPRACAWQASENP